MEKQITRTKFIFLAVLPSLAILASLLYLIIRTILLLISDYQWFEKLLAICLLGAEVFIVIHGIGYFINIFHILFKKRTLLSQEESLEPINKYPPIAVVLASYKEPLDVVENTLTCFYNLTYPNKQIFLLDDTRYELPADNYNELETYKKDVEALCQKMNINLFRRKWHGAKAGMINDFLDYIEGHPKEGSILYQYSKETYQNPKYIAIFDADQNPSPDFLKDLVIKMETNPKLAFIQTPQYYTNFEFNRIARASGLLQAVFYEYICEGKSIKDAMFCCGTNVVFRVNALIDVGGFDDTSVTEDFATSLKFHLKGWQSAYYNKASAFGMGPEDLGGYFKQQFRWALGTVGLIRDILREIIRGKNKLSFAKWWEYFLSSTHYFIGLVFFIMVICPVIYIFFDVPSYFASPDIYFLFFLPYIILSLGTFSYTLIRRQYKIKDILIGQLLISISFPVYIKACLCALLGIKGQFVVTPKGQSSSLPMKNIWAQISLSIICFSSVIWGVNRLIYERRPIIGLCVNIFWCLYNFLLLSSILYFNNPDERENR